jgi:DNA polymerase-3 subunit delta'
MPFTVDEAFELLSRARERGRFAQAYLISGPAGSGKRALIGKLAAALLREDSDPFAHPDVHAIEPQMKTRVIGADAMRELLGKLQMRSLRGGAKIAVIVDADRLNDAAANGLLRTLEEPPGPTYFFLTSTQPEQILTTILSRCIEIPLRQTARPPITPRQAALLDALSQAPVGGDLASTFTLVRHFNVLLAEAKTQIEEENEADLAKITAQFKQVGARKEQIEDREDSHKALVESKYRAARAELLGLLEQWFADALRQQHGAPELEFQQYESVTRHLAERCSSSDLLRRMAALGELRDHLNRTVNEQLAIECGFLKAFGSLGVGAN